VRVWGWFVHAEDSGAGCSESRRCGAGLRIMKWIRVLWVLSRQGSNLQSPVIGCAWRA
jgi:hypothetical protein